MWSWNNTTHAFTYQQRANCALISFKFTCLTLPCLLSRFRSVRTTHTHTQAHPFYSLLLNLCGEKNWKNLLICARGIANECWVSKRVDGWGGWLIVAAMYTWDVYILTCSLPCDETALDRAKSILFATIMMGRVRIKSKSWSDISSCSTRVYDALSTHEYTKTNASALIYSSYVCKQWKCQTNASTQSSERTSMRTNEKRNQVNKVKKNVFDCLKISLILSMM